MTKKMILILQAALRQLNKIGLVILTLVWSISYYLKFIDPVKNQLAIDYMITFGYCFGTALISYYYGKKEANRFVKIMFYYTISIFNVSVILTYLIDLLADSLFGTTKIIWTIIITTFSSLCIYLFGKS